MNWKSFDWKLLAKNAKTTVLGIIGFLFAIPVFYTAINSWATGQPVNWKLVLVGVMGALVANSTGNMMAKDSTTHSTIDEVKTATNEADKAAQAPNP